MKRANQYWTVLALLGFFHLNLWLGERIPFYILIVMTGGVAYFLSRRVLLHLEYVGWKWNGLLAVLQGLLFFFYIVELPFWLHLLPLTLFIGLEFVRAYWEKKSLCFCAIVNIMKSS
ncbi:hypothetical protein [Caldalkalibacillus mannanilyticus]|uniref:hypothetical protein n=1 Tax=Caldalkalibacillus mannanilyticus TaxID=1418 RepID=UPI000AD41FC8|nr:hypothetical protein [Caldalkalibacillus mannanilyticus]